MTFDGGQSTAPPCAPRSRTGAPELSKGPEPREAFYLHPGRVWAGRGEAAVKTILGSCVAVCLWDVQRGVGGMNHYLLPLRIARREASDRFGEIALATLLGRVLQAGGARERLRAKIYGGACVVGNLAQVGGELGTRNAELAEDFLRNEGIAVVLVDVGGRTGRRVVFRAGDGATWVRGL